MISYLSFDNEESLKRAKAIGIYFDHKARMWYTTDIINFRKLDKYYLENGYRIHTPKKKPKKLMCYEKGYKKPIKNKA